MESEQLEDESPVTRLRRNRAIAFYWSAAFGLALLFAFSYEWAERIGGVAAALVPVAILSLWWGLYAHMISALDERDRAIETRAIAAAGAVTLWLLITSTALHEIGGLWEPPIALILPVAALLYAAFRFIWQRVFL